ncbi:hypothetical protein CMU40_14590 [Elizabethkingia anophelis]|uniref:hypothetical protein n=1 Tax=Elizabethkingia anophelis TaxID=1117645 RepID=UPI0021A3EFD2|nr:hypothetical protein [Elizabethkingia anophelis]MCT3828392.1 hypothetical protein [Elizabethkingia anophelis]MCT3839227.1 hypothetical protein [Elizabethkingia anophelis]MCT3842896.1 hypothetical protein [Elizabethkingia anophelis]MCT3850104.1 hypothetical protein [Elizabethkingia anophelis]
MDKGNHQFRDSFNKIYSLIGSAETLSHDISDTRICRFCGKNDSEVNFKKIAHACPELLGQNNLVIYDECDSCNENFSKYESHLSKFFAPYLSIIGVRGKKKIPSFQSRKDNDDENLRTSVKYTDDGKINMVLSSLDDYNIDIETKTMSIRFRHPAIKPIYVYKSLLKVALSFLPQNKIQKYQLLFDWLQSDDTEVVFFSTLFITKLTRKKFGKPSVQLYEANRIFTDKGFYPELTLVVNFANIVCQIYLPLSESFDYSKFDGKSPTLELYPAFFYNIDSEKHKNFDPKTPITVNYKFESIDLNSYENMIRDEVMNFTFESGDFNIGK